MFHRDEAAPEPDWSRLPAPRAGITISVAGMLALEPAVLLATARNVAPLSAVIACLIVYVASVAPAMSIPFFCHW